MWRQVWSDYSRANQRHWRLSSHVTHVESQEQAFDRFPFVTIIVGDSIWILATCCNTASHFALIAAQPSVLGNCQVTTFDCIWWGCLRNDLQQPQTLRLTSPTTYLTIWSLILSFFILASFSTKAINIYFSLYLPTSSFWQNTVAFFPPAGDTLSTRHYDRLTWCFFFFFFLNGKELEQVVSVLHQSESRQKLRRCRPKFQQHYVWHNEALQRRWLRKDKMD